MLRLGLCCIFVKEEIHFRTTTATYLLKHPQEFRKEYLSEIILDNIANLKKAIQFCFENKIGCFRITSRFFPLMTHPEAGYELSDLPAFSKIEKELSDIKQFAKAKGVRLTLHPDQFVVLNSKNKEVVVNSIKELQYHASLADYVGADVINIHGGGVYGDKRAALKRLEETICQLKPEVRKLLTLENDDRSFTPYDLLPLCEKLKIPLVYDVHHHRCLKDSLSIQEATEKALKTWNREPLFHLSSPKEGWNQKNIKNHSDYIDIEDFPKSWLHIPELTVEIEAKLKELAVFDFQKKIMNYL
ncbi:MAG TPA: UV DNA damage repair endonuclease UvsE [Chlamydiales bacterium]|nr:UV DNA damage repair endonuclease UvsE [Chlamydiales bacterium]